MIPSSWIISVNIIDIEALVWTNHFTKGLLILTNKCKVLLQWFLLIQILKIVGVPFALITIAILSASLCFFLLFSPTFKEIPIILE